MNDSWSVIARLLARYRGVLLGGLGSAIAVAATLDPAAGLARSSLRFALWFAVVSVLLTITLTAALTIAERLAARRPYLQPRSSLPRAIAANGRKRYSASSSAR